MSNQTKNENPKEAFNRELIDFLGSSPTPFHAVATMASHLMDEGFVQLKEESEWSLVPGKYFVTKNDSSIVAFVLGTREPLKTGIRMVGAHTDSPCLKVKPNPEKRMKEYLNLGVEVYGGVLLNPWFDRDLSLAGRVTFKAEDDRIYNRLVNFKHGIATIPSLAIHLDREANSSRSINSQKDIPPLLLNQKTKQSFSEILASQLADEHADIKLKKILGYEMSFYDTNPAGYVGLNQEFIAGARLDNLLSCFVGMKSLINADSGLTSLLVCNDHEEVGSTSAEGAQGPFLRSVLERMIPDLEARHRTIAMSLLISTDNAHGVHPNYPDRHDPNHGPVLNRGPVIKINSNQRYATNSVTAGYFNAICDRLKVPCQTFVVRTDMACGSTIGPLTAKEIGVKTLDVGVPTFAMHSIRELAGSDDATYLYRALQAFYTDEGELGTSGLI
ncbi:MAG: M18 family aminopeptidase [bacterium]|nr:M18 family aminopeptidase [Gammaproteobacteria bacterium]HIL98362.1 M18 family aminopeptidase [Pseudomonadales bacterium]